MKVSKMRGDDERRILIGMITDQVVVGKVAARWTGEGLFRSKWANLIGGWCCRYHGRYSKAPGESIESMFRSWASASQRDEKMAEAVGRFLSGLSDEYERAAGQNSEYLVDLAGKHFQRVALENMVEEIQADLDYGDDDKAVARVQQFGKIELGEGSLVDVLQDEAVIASVFEEAADPPMIEWPGAVGEFFGRAMERDSFVIFLGPEKRGKTFWLIEAAWRAMLQKKRVLFLEIGDMSEKQIMRRFMVRAARQPFRAATVKKPVKIWRNEDDCKIEVEHEEVVFAHDLNFSVARRACEKIVRGKVGSYLKLGAYPVNSMSVAGIRNILRGLAHDGWEADLVVVDYPAVLEMGDWKEKRHAIDRAWGSLRGLAQEFHCCMLTATQADAASYAKTVLTMDNFSDSKTKNAHATGIVGLNQTREEREVGALRLNWVALRENDSGFTEFKCVAVAECRPLARVQTVSCW
jgi:hypothetical protein